MSDLISTAQVCELLGIQPQTWRNWAATGRWDDQPKPVLRLGKSNRYDRNAVMAFASRRALS